MADSQYKGGAGNNEFANPIFHTDGQTTELGSGVNGVSAASCACVSVRISNAVVLRDVCCF